MNTALNTLAEKLDAIESTELGMTLDDARLWNQLSPRIAPRKKVAVVWWFAAACILAAILVLPSIFDTQQKPIELVSAVETPPVIEKEQPLTQVVEESPTEKEVRPKMTLMYRDALRADVRLASIEQLDMQILLIPVVVKPKEKQEKQHFSNKDISIIQANLERPKAEKGMKVSVRAQLYTSSNHSKTDYKKLKIKLNAKNK